MFKIGFNGFTEEYRKTSKEEYSICPAVTPRKSVVRVHFRHGIWICLTTMTPLT